VSSIDTIDIHTHLHPPKLFAAIRRWFAEHSEWDMAGAPTEPQAVADVLHAHGVRRFVFCSYAHKPGMASDLNAWLAQTSRDLGGYGLPLATVHPGDAGCLDDLRTALDDGCIGLKLHEDVQRLEVDDARLEPVFATLAERGAFALVHVGPIPWDYPPDAGAARVARVLERHPQLRLVVAHYGVPDTDRFFALMDEHPGLYLDTTMVFASQSPMHISLARPHGLETVPEIDCEALEMHADRVLYGTDYPNIPFTYPTERDAIVALGLGGATQRAILHDNAAALIAQVSARGRR